MVVQNVALLRETVEKADLLAQVVEDSQHLMDRLLQIHTIKDSDNDLILDVLNWNKEDSLVKEYRMIWRILRVVVRRMCFSVFFGFFMGGCPHRLSGFRDHYAATLCCVLIGELLSGDFVTII